MLLDVANTFLFQQGIEDCIPVEDIESPVLARSRDILKRKLAHFKQQRIIAGKDRSAWIQNQVLWWSLNFAGPDQMRTRAMWII